MSANMIAAVIITVLSCVAVVFFVVLLSSGVLQRLKKEVFRYIKVYNAYLEEAAAKDEEKAKDTDLQIKEEAIGLPADPAIPFIAKNAPMQKQDFFADYLKIRSAFRANPTQVLKDFPKENPSAGNVAWYRKMLDKLSFDSVYKISCLQEEQQKEVLREVFSEEEREVLEAYVESLSYPFSVTEFVLYLKAKSREADDTVYLFAREPENLGVTPTSEQLKLCKDENLCEGFQVMQGNRLYDYGLRSSEMIL